MTVHSLVLTDRGQNHIHRWAPTCSCGKWIGVFRRNKAEAVAQHRQHVNGPVGDRKNAYQNKPRPLTPRDKLPEALR